MKKIMSILILTLMFMSISISSCISSKSFVAKWKSLQEFVKHSPMFDAVKSNPLNI